MLDEVEAALDEANVFRFAQYLKKYSHETQFIVITHRKGTMEEADVLYGKRFAETFAQISSHFEDVFRALFGGGRAELKLTDPNDLLQSGVDIIAQPPGKKLQNLSLLSGGERAFSPEEARKRVKLIKLAIEELGTVNLGSIEEFERVNERYLFLSEQKDDLLEAKNTLFKVIEEMDEEMTLQKGLETEELELKEMKRQYKQMAGLLKDEEVKLGRMEVELDNLLSFLREEYGLSFEGAREKYPLELLARLEEEYAENAEALKVAEEDLSFLTTEMSSNSSGEEKLEEAAKKKLNDKNKTAELIASRREQRMNKRRKEELEEKLASIAGELQRLDSEIEAMTERKQTQTSTKEALQSELTDLKVVLAKTEQSCANERENKALKQTIQELDAKLQSLREDGERLRSEQQEIKGRLYELEIAEKNVNSHLELYDQEKSALLEGDEDNDLAKRLGHRYRIVTLEGDVVNPGGSMTGGAVKKKSSSLLGRNRELEAQTKRLAEMEEKTELLEKEVFGRATFLPLSVIKERRIQPRDIETAKENPSFIGIASELVSFDPAYRSVVQNLLGTVLITEHLKGANFYQGVKEVLKAKSELPGIRGAIAELLKTDERYETAIEIALGATAQHVVTEDEDAARRAIQYLKKHSTEHEFSLVDERLHSQIQAFRDAQKSYEQKKSQYEKKESALYQAYQYVQQARSKKEMLEAMQEDFSGSENVEEEIEQLKSDYFELLNEQASVRNELQFLEDQMTQSAAQQKRLAQNNEKYLSERKEIADQKMKEVLKERKKNATQNRAQLEEAIVQRSEKERTLKEKIAAQKLVFEKLETEAKELARQVKEKNQALSGYGKWEALQQKVEKAKDEEMSSSAAIQAKEAKIEEARDKIQALDESVDELQQVLLLTSEELEKLEGRKRKKKAENKLFETQDNLNRVEDILHELEGQVEPLKVQASIAKDYLEKKDELEKIEIALTAYDIEELHSGESEFLINNQPCRLKDIIDLFMDSGLGKEAFSIISQGKVEEILSSKAEERRSIFEEAAGVLKYKTTDAIRWVLGEQSAKSLRGGKMEDIIFAGSDSRKKLNLAEVTLTLDNDDRFLPIDFHEVSVTRRVYRGISMYFEPFP
ncbi:hypothetical protein DT075_24825 [Bacillus licheniformis]|nr:hypothetical protein DT075_24825 [Bacillus licheniformis]